MELSERESKADDELLRSLRRTLFGKRFKPGSIRRSRL